jgi:hypothetical protein
MAPPNPSTAEVHGPGASHTPGSCKHQSSSRTGRRSRCSYWTRPATVLKPEHTHSRDRFRSLCVPRVAIALATNRAVAKPAIGDWRNAEGRLDDTCLPARAGICTVGAGLAAFVRFRQRDGGRAASTSGLVWSRGDRAGCREPPLRLGAQQRDVGVAGCRSARCGVRAAWDGFAGAGRHQREQAPTASSGTAMPAARRMQDPSGPQLGPGGSPDLRALLAQSAP